MKLIIRDINGNLKTAGIKPGSFVKIFQGSSRKDSVINLVNYSEKYYESFLEYESMPELTFGSGIYFVKKDFYLTLLESDFDSSD